MDYTNDIKRLKKEILSVSYSTKEGHIPTSFSILDILYVLYKDVMNYDPSNPKSPDRDYLVVSKGHASLGVYAILAEFGFFDKKELYTFGSFHSRLGGHPDFNKVPGVEASTGSLGHGFPMAVGISLGLKIRNSRQKVFCILGDGEANEGSVWEGILLAAQNRLSNLICIFDYNHSIEKSISWGDVKLNFNSFGWETIEINGHNHEEIKNALLSIHDKPLAIIANTIKGFGCKSMEDDPSAWHHRSPNEEEYRILLNEIGE